MMKSLFRFISIVILSLNVVYAQWFAGNSLFVGSGASQSLQSGAKLYIQNDAFPALTLIGSYTYLNWMQPGVVYTQGGTDYIIGADQTIHQNTFSLGLGATVWAKGNFYVDMAASYFFLQELTFAEPIQDASFPISGYSAELGVGYNLGYWSLRPYYAFFSFSDDYTVLNQTMLELKAQHTFGLELIYWY